MVIGDILKTPKNKLRCKIEHGALDLLKSCSHIHIFNDELVDTLRATWHINLTLRLIITIIQEVAN